MKNIFNIKSYLKFLSRNKVYALIDIFGLSVSLMFVILIGAYYFHESNIDKYHAKADRIYVLGVDCPDGKITGGHWGLQSKLKSRYPEIESSCAVNFNTRVIKNSNGENIKNNMLLVDSTFYSIFDFQLLQGDRNTALDAPNKVVLSRECARKYFGNSDPVGKTIAFNDSTLLTVSGIMAPMKNTCIQSADKSDIDMIAGFDLMIYFNWASSKESEELSNASGSDIYLLCYPNSNILSKQKDITKYFKSFYWFYNMPDYKVTATLTPFDELYFSGRESSSANHTLGDSKLVKILFAVGLLILVFAVMNYINLTVALGGFRAKEMATRRLLGSSRANIICRLITESTVLCTVSCIIGILLAFLFAPYASALLDTKLELADAVTPLNIFVLVVAILLLGVIAGVIPAFAISSAKPIDVVRGTFRKKSKMVFSKIFITFQNAITIILIACSLVMILQIRYMINAPLGYDTENIMSIGNPGAGKSDVFIEELNKLACVQSVSKAQGMPFNGGNNNTYKYNGKTVSMQIFIGDENYMDILGLKIEKDNNVPDENGAYLNSRALNELGLDKNSTSFPFNDTELPLRGIVRDFHVRSLESLQHPLMIKIKKDIKNPWQFLVKVTGNPIEAYDDVARVYKKVFNMDIPDSHPFISQQIQYTYDSQIRLSKIVSLFSVIAIVISLLGLLAMSTYFIQQRKKEVAIRKVFGCGNNEILSRLIRTFLMYVVIAFVIAVPIIYYFMTDWISQYSYRIDISWWIYLLAGMFCMLVSFGAVFIQSYQAANANPVNSLKKE